LKEAMLYQKSEDSEVVCNLCHHRCKIKDTKQGICGVRENRQGILYSLVYRKLISQAVDPIEKKPLFHFLPASTSLSIATVGCNFRCRHCQNADIAQMPHDLHRILGEDVAPEAIVKDAAKRGCESISYTYTEPTIFFEYAYDTARLAHEQGIRNVFVSNGYMTEEAVDLIAPYLDAINIDLKGLEPFYKKICGAHMQPVVENIRRMHKLGIWVEVTTLVIPTLNDGDDELRKLAEIVAGIDPCIPWHISAFHPSYRLLDKPRTSSSIIRRAREIGTEAGLRYVFEGNLPGEKGENTYCYQCGELLIERICFTVIRNRIQNGACPDCGTVIDGVWS
jgi:pyruvate formate lyase activating enzyme